MEDILLELATNSPVYAILLFWIMAERKERLELKNYVRGRENQLLNIILRLSGNGQDADEIA